MRTTRIFEILCVLGALEISLQTNLQGSKDAKVLQGLFSEQHPAFCTRKAFRETIICACEKAEHGRPVAYYTCSYKQYEPCLFQSGNWFGTPEEGFDVGAQYLY